MKPCRRCGGSERNKAGDCAACDRAGSRRRYAKNKKRRIAAAADYQRANPEVNKRASLRWRQNNPELRIWSAVRSRAVRKGIEFSIAVADIVIPAVCPVLGIPLVAGHGRGRGHLEESPSLDRVDNTRGYVPGNIAVISGRANKIKNSGSADEHRRIADWMEAMSK